MPSFSPRAVQAVIVSSVIFVADQITKYMAVGGLTTAFHGKESFGARLSAFLWERHPQRDGRYIVHEDFWSFFYAENPGAAWSLLRDAPDWFRTPFFLSVSVAAMIFIVFYFRKTTPDQKWLRMALALVFGGAIGNFCDRVRLGYVIDFIDWHWFEKATWPTFNIADSAITVGVVIMVADMLFHKPGEAAVPARAQGR
jgi:signal peptidase II